MRASTRSPTKTRLKSRLKLSKGSTKVRSRPHEGSFSAATEEGLRRLLRAIVIEKGYFGRHDDPLSHLVYDVLFDLYANARPAPSGEAFLEAYVDLIAFGDGHVTTDGYCEDFTQDWLKTRLASGAITKQDGVVRLTNAHKRVIEERLVRFR